MQSPLLQTEVLTPEQVLDLRIERLSQWLRENAGTCVEEQAHIDLGARERVFWHYGYLIALRDVRDLLSDQEQSLN
jgi:hypothetical protein